MYFKRISILFAVCLCFTACSQTTSVDKTSAITDEKDKPSVATEEKNKAAEKNPDSDSLTVTQVLDAFKQASLPYEASPFTDPTLEFGTQKRGYVEPEISTKISVPDGVTDKKVEGYVLVYTKKDLLESMKIEFETMNKDNLLAYPVYIYTIKNVLVLLYGNEHMTQEKFDEYTKALEGLK